MRCPVCGEYAGAATRCSHCGAVIQVLLSLRIFRWAALGLATVGLGLLFAMSRYREIPLVRVGDIERSMNFAFVRMRGDAVDDARIFRRDGRVESVRFTLCDETGEIVVRAQRDRAQWLEDREMVPSVGDRMEVVGSLNVTPDGASLWIQAPEKVSRTRRARPRTPLAEIRPEDAGRSFLVAGEISSVRPPRRDSNAPCVVELRDESGTARLVIFPNVHAELADPVLFKAGARIEARVTAGVYRGDLQLTLQRGADRRPAAGVVG